MRLAQELRVSKNSPAKKNLVIEINCDRQKLLATTRIKLKPTFLYVLSPTELNTIAKLPQTDSIFQTSGLSRQKLPRKLRRTSSSRTLLLVESSEFLARTINASNEFSKTFLVFCISRVWNRTKLANLALEVKSNKNIWF